MSTVDRYKSEISTLEARKAALQSAKPEKDDSRRTAEIVAISAKIAATRDLLIEAEQTVSKMRKQTTDQQQQTTNPIDPPRQ